MKDQGRSVMVSKMAQVAAECIRIPGQTSVWSKAAGKYVCSNDPGYKQALAQQTAEVVAAHPPINSMFKIVFLTVAIGTLVSFLGCALMAYVTGEKPHDMQVALFRALLNAGSTGVGGVMGLLGGQTLRE